MQTDREKVFIIFTFNNFTQKNTFHTETTWKMKCFSIIDSVLFYQNTSKDKLKIQRKTHLKMCCMLKNKLFPNFMQNENGENIVHEDLWTWRS